MMNELRNGQLRSIIAANPKKLVAVDFGNPGCPPCRAIKPWWDTLPKKFPHVVFCSAMCDSCPIDAQSYRITATPTFVFVLDGKEVNRILGPNKSQILATIEKYKTNGDPFAGSGRSLGGGGSSAAPKSHEQSDEYDEFVKNMLIEMGFEEKVALGALKATRNGTIDECIVYLEKIQNMKKSLLMKRKNTDNAQ